MVMAAGRRRDLEKRVVRDELVASATATAVIADMAREGHTCGE